MPKNWPASSAFVEECDRCNALMGQLTEWLKPRKKHARTGNIEPEQVAVIKSIRRSLERITKRLDYS